MVPLLMITNACNLAHGGAASRYVGRCRNTPRSRRYLAPALAAQDPGGGLYGNDQHHGGYGRCEEPISLVEKFGGLRYGMDQYATDTGDLGRLNRAQHGHRAEDLRRRPVPGMPCRQRGSPRPSPEPGPAC